MIQTAIKEIAIYHPQNQVNNQLYIDHFSKQGKDITNFLAAMGREHRYTSKDVDETPLTTAIKATELVLQKAHLTLSDMDMIIFTSQTPETTVPSNAVRLFDHFQGKPNTIIYDLNANCAGMTVALEQISHYMNSNKKINRALIVGSDHLTLFANPSDPLSYACFGDGTAAIIVERTTEDCGFIDSMYHVNTIFAEKMMFPAEGLTKGIRETGDLKEILTIPFDGSIVLDATYEMFDTLFARYNINPSEVKYCLSQFALSNIIKIKERYNLTDAQVPYIGNEFAYTGTSSPFLALHAGIEAGQIKRGDYVMFWTIGTGFELIATLYKY
ncbi:MAG: 3-oxoacyl-[acyl-carrier-protein] synthase III C-terminal domain-containing protein [Solibacillus sp.]